MNKCINLRCKEPVWIMTEAQSFYSRKFPKNTEFCVDCWHLICCVASNRMFKDAIVWPLEARNSNTKDFDAIVKEVRLTLIQPERLSEKTSKEDATV